MSSQISSLNAALAVKTKRQNILVVLIVLCLVCFGLHYYFSQAVCSAVSDSSSCMAVGAGLKFVLTNVMGQIGNAGLVFTLLWYFGWPAVQKMVASRRETLEREVEQSSKLKAEAQVVAAEAKAKIDRLDQEIQELEVNYRAASDEECQQIAQAALASAARIKEVAEESFELTSNVAKASFEKEITLEAIERARVEITNKLAASSELRNQLIDQSIAALEL